MLPTASSEAVEATIAASASNAAGSGGGPLIGQTYNSLLVSTSRTNTELPLLATLQPRRPPTMEATTAAALQDYPSDYGLPLHLGK